MELFVLAGVTEAVVDVRVVVLADDADALASLVADAVVVCETGFPEVMLPEMLEMLEVADAVGIVLVSNRARGVGTRAPFAALGWSLHASFMVSTTGIVSNFWI